MNIKRIKLAQQKIYIGVSRGTSMNPLINSGDKLFVIKTNRIKLGDIVVFVSGKKLVSHRVIRKKKSLILTKGDNVPFVDGYTMEHTIIGKLIEIRGNNYIIRLTSKKATATKYYFLLRSTVLFYVPLMTFRLLCYFMPGSSWIRRVLTEKYHSPS